MLVDCLRTLPSQMRYSAGESAAERVNADVGAVGKLWVKYCEGRLTIKYGRRIAASATLTAAAGESGSPSTAATAVTPPAGMEHFPTEN